MNSFEINKILGALLGTCLVLLAIHIASGAIFDAGAPAKPGYEIAVKEETEAPPGGSRAGGAAAVPIETLLASASVGPRRQVAKQCQACHNFQEGQGPKVGPDLYGVVGRPVASVAGFNYSAALKAKGGTWTFDALEQMAHQSPRRRSRHSHDLRRHIEREAARRRDRLPRYSLSANPVPLPKAYGLRRADEVTPASRRNHRGFSGRLRRNWFRRGAHRHAGAIVRKCG